ncbi:GNAT family N-acetyltransferase [Oricola cellulosilytica]|uniref:N-acetyltransferase n=1 Tax=Oricola cellulosilytica TaxID=1429082 RepID=A0A4R0P863_9HYPH|nr:GNAT family N-acetyltransferase [Oricola cellulosilytica]TCD13219.1 N-acetyltransferase [Oricola cellulosilytica]
MTETKASIAAASNEPDGDFVIRVRERISSVDPSIWGGLTGASLEQTKAPYNPFVSHAFLSALEDSGCAIAETGWLGQHLTLETGSGTVLGALPCYLKSHSQGEYVFDHGWADAFERAGGRYYPKLQCSVPFTPATGPRLLVSPGRDASVVRNGLAEGLKALATRLGVSSAHVTFAEPEDIAALKESGFLHRLDQQFHFENNGYGDFGEFLETLSSRKRKNIRKERQGALENGITIERLAGADIIEAAMDSFFAFYTDTGSRKWGRPYLNREFYALISERMRDDILLVMAKRDGRYVAGAINFIGGDTLYGRHWGCVEHHPYLHFEVCYYQAIDFAIAEGLRYVEAGAQGEHKLARGYMPVTTHSAHFIPHEGFRRAIADYLDHERMDVERFGRILSAHGPFKKGG